MVESFKKFTPGNLYTNNRDIYYEIFIIDENEQPEVLVIDSDEEDEKSEEDAAEIIVVPHHHGHSYAVNIQHKNGKSDEEDSESEDFNRTSY